MSKSQCFTLRDDYQQPLLNSSEHMSHNFPQSLILHTNTMQCCGTQRSPSLGPIAVLGRQESTHQTAPDRVEGRMPCQNSLKPCPHILHLLVPTQDRQGWPYQDHWCQIRHLHKYLECASYFSKFLLSAPTTCPP